MSRSLETFYSLWNSSYLRESYTAELIRWLGRGGSAVRNQGFRNRAGRAGRVPTGAVVVSVAVGVVVAVSRYRPRGLRVEKRLAALHYELLDLREGLENGSTSGSAAPALRGDVRASDPLLAWLVSNGDTAARGGTYG